VDPTAIVVGFCRLELSCTTLRNPTTTKVLAKPAAAAAVAAARAAQVKMYAKKKK